MIVKVKVNKKEASLVWGGIHPGYWVSAREVDQLTRVNGDTELTLISVGSGYEIDGINELRWLKWNSKKLKP